MSEREKGEDEDEKNLQHKIRNPWGGGGGGIESRLSAQSGVRQEIASLN